MRSQFDSDAISKRGGDINVSALVMGVSGIPSSYSIYSTIVQGPMGAAGDMVMADSKSFS